MMRENYTNFFDYIRDRSETINSTLCVGLDPDPRRIPKFLGNGPEAVFKFCVEIIEATADHVVAFKPNIAFFEALGVEGWNVLQQVLERIPQEVPVIMDAKRSDIGNTALQYARGIFDRLKADAVTINPYMGFDSIEPFLEYEQRGIYALCLTSNDGAKDFQLHQDLYLKVARKISEWNTAKNLGMVVGATKPQHLANILSVAPDVPLLIPGLGAQGGDLESILSVASHVPPHQIIFNVSRSIIYAATDETFGRQARIAARYYCNRINNAREKTRAEESKSPVSEHSPE